MSRRKKEVDAELLERVAELFYYEEKPHKKILDDPVVKGKNVTHESQLSNLLSEARRRGVVYIEVDRSFAITGNEDEALGRQLRDKFELGYAAVLEVEASGKDSYAGDDYLHRALANRAGEKLKERIESSEYIAVAGGRAVYHTVQAIRRRRPSQPNTRVTPLCGRVWSNSWEVHGPGIRRPQDADDAAFILALAFERQRGTKFSHIECPLFATSPQRARIAVKEHCTFLPGGTWKKNVKPSRAIVGVGVVDPNSGHRLAVLLKDEPQPVPGDQYLKRASGPLKKALSIVSLNKLPFFGDVANRLFPALPLPSQLTTSMLSKLNDSYEQLNRVLNQLNAKMVTINWRHLQGVKTITAVAGGDFKINAIWTVLIAKLLEPSHSRAIVTELYTDTETARRLLEALDNYERADPAIQNWYLGKTKKLFDN